MKMKGVRIGGWGDEGEGWGARSARKQVLTSISWPEGRPVRVVGPIQIRRTVSEASRALKTRTLTSGISRLSLGTDFPAFFSVFPGA